MKKRTPNFVPLQAWAKKRIAEVSRESGISEEQIHHDALRFGLPIARDAYYTLVRLRKSSEKLWNDDTGKNSAGPESIPSNANGDGGETFPEAASEGSISSDERLDDVGERSGPSPEDTENLESASEELIPI